MKKILIILFALNLSLVTFAENNETKQAKSESETAKTVDLKGSVQDLQTGEMLVGVEVKIEGTNLKTYTNLDGNFTFSSVKPGDYKVVANYISYEKNTQSFTVSGNSNEVKLKLQNSN
jgi:hypothetical protein